MKKVRKAVIPAAGLGTRVLPATKVMPKEMLPIVDKPAIQYIVEEAAASGIEDILIITNRGKGLLEDHFDRAPELERRLAGDPAKEAILNQVVGISKLANIFYDRRDNQFGYDNIGFDADIDPLNYCRRAEELFELYQVCANRRQIETICLSYLRMLEATKVSSTGHLYFIPRQHMDKVDTFETFIEQLSAINQNDNALSVNSFYIIDDAKQRDKMTEEFYSAVKKEIALYQEKADYLIQSGSRSPSVMERWVNKIATLEQKKQHYEEILRRELDGLDDDFETLRLLSQELSVRANGLRFRKAA